MKPNTQQGPAVLVFCGTGGVGKTTLSASKAIQLAHQGNKVLVITMDPAKRLVQSLGLTALGHTPKRIDLVQRIQTAFTEKTGELWAMMPDTTKSFIDFFHRISPEPEIAEKICSHKLFQTLARDFSGANEYMALHQLVEHTRANEYDYIILDTPPNRNTLLFFETPQTLAKFFEEPLVRMILEPGNRLLAFGIHKAVDLLRGLIGDSFMHELLTFLALLLRTEKGFRSELSQASAILSSENLKFVLVFGPTPENIQEAIHFSNHLIEKKFRLHSLILNRTLVGIPPGAETTTPGTARASLIAKRHQKLLEQWQTYVSALPAPKPKTITLPELTRDVHGISDLEFLAKKLDG